MKTGSAVERRAVDNRVVVVATRIVHKLTRAVGGDVGKEG